MIFISIDDHEVVNLSNVCNEIFGEDNFVERFIWQSGRTSASIFTREHEYILAYAKDRTQLTHLV
ncbi:DNA methyltransferase, partial [Xenorhabdus sp. XENO-10]